MRALATLLLVLTLALPLTACGSTRSGTGGFGGHRLISGAFCALSAYALYRDVRAHRLGWSAFQGILAAHNCHQAFRRPY